MVWFARWRPKWRKIFIGTMILASLAGALKGVHEYRKYAESKIEYAQFKTVISQILKIEETIKNRMHNFEVNTKLLKDAEEYKSFAEVVLKEREFAEAKKNYKIALVQFELVDYYLPSLELDYMKAKLEHIRKLWASELLTNDAKEVIDNVNISLDDAIRKVEELKLSVSKEIYNMKAQISSLELLMGSPNK